MEEMYLPIKHSHMTFVAITVVLFNLRFWLRTAKPNAVLPGALKMLPHINDTLILMSGMMMMTIAGWQPFGNALWLGYKLGLVVLYIVFGFICIKAPARSVKSLAAYAVCMAFIALIVWLAHWKAV